MLRASSRVQISERLEGPREDQCAKTLRRWSETLASSSAAEASARWASSEGSSVVRPKRDCGGG